MKKIWIPLFEHQIVDNMQYQFLMSILAELITEQDFIVRYGTVGKLYPSVQLDKKTGMGPILHTFGYILELQHEGLEPYFVERIYIDAFTKWIDQSLSGSKKEQNG